MSHAHEIEKLLAKTAERGIATDGEPAVDRHIVFCGGEKCCEGKDGDRAWKRLKERTAELRAAGTPRVLRTRALCLQLCKAGPIAVVYPDGTWYHSVDEDIVDRIIDEHVLGGRVVRSHCFAHDPLAG